MNGYQGRQQHDLYLWQIRKRKSGLQKGQAHAVIALLGERGSRCRAINRERKCQSMKNKALCVAGMVAGLVAVAAIEGGALGLAAGSILAIAGAMLVLATGGKTGWFYE